MCKTGISNAFYSKAFEKESEILPGLMLRFGLVLTLLDQYQSHQKRSLLIMDFVCCVDSLLQMLVKVNKNG